MAHTHLLRPDCPECGKPAKEKDHFFAVLPKMVNGKPEPQRTKLIMLECGHTIKEEQFNKFDFTSVANFDGSKKLFPFQAEACERMVKAGFRGLFRLDMGLGKTVLASTLLRHYWKELTPCLIICKASMTEQWLMELLDWCPDRVFQILENSKDKPLDGFKVFIVSQDLLAPRYDKKARREKGGLPWLRDFPLNTIIYDEVQHIKNPEASRTRFVQDLVAKTKYFIPLSGTPIKNNAGEYFNCLNAIDPINFRYRSEFLDVYCHSYYDDNGRLHVGGLKKGWQFDQFKRLTAPYIIEYEREVVLPQLPRIFRQNRFFNLDIDANKAYQKEMDEFFDIADEEQDAWERGKKLGQSLMKMYHIVGVAKAEPVVDYVQDWLEEHDEEKELLVFNGADGTREVRIKAKPKIVIFIHHIDVGTIIESRLNAYLAEHGEAPCARLLGGLSSEQSSKIERDFRDDPRQRVLIASTLAAGEGKNFQFCSDAVMAERQWNPPNEHQAECRFPRPGSTASQVNILYPVAVGTFDEYQAELVEKKRTYIDTTKGKWSDYNESNFMKELIEKLTKEGRNKWRLR